MYRLDSWGATASSAKLDHLDESKDTLMNGAKGFLIYEANVRIQNNNIYNDVKGARSGTTRLSYIKIVI